MFSIAECLIAMSVLLGAVYWYLTKNNSHWKKKNIRFVKPTLLFGNMGSLITQSRSFGYFIMDTYKAFPDEKVVGMFAFRNPGLLIRDPELVHKILVTDFNSFRNNDFEINEDADPILGRNIFYQRDDKWKRSRSLMTPAFTSGKIKHIYTLMESVADDLVEYLAAKDAPFEMKSTLSRYTAEVVARCGLGIQGNNFTEENPKMQQVGREIFESDLIKGLKYLLLFVAPRVVSKWLDVRVVPQTLIDYFNDILHNVIIHRQTSNEKRSDLIEFLIEIKKKSSEVVKGNVKSSLIDKAFTDDDILSGCVMFFIEGYETSAVALSFMLYTLSKRRDIQAKIRQELEEAVAKNNNQLTYEIVQDLTYLNCFTLESHRKYPVLYTLMKLCTEDYEMDIGREEPLTVAKGTSVLLPIVAIHNDPQYWDRPEEFLPERFLDNQDAAARTKGYYFPFGDGPRMCIGTRMATTLIKLALIKLVAAFDILPTESTPTEIEYDPKSFFMSHKGGLHVQFVRRDNKV